eukprot:TRINITY_DN110927_c0_g1_i1.p1 TRINITY_DN110927_c0_g1~~TRINITY_DN110927_c0_g1_i1.p1  ORF type:complete len:289 (+),score=65.86 TRINITY_DN110927_c0_g1_i1:54-920(+)
MENDELDETFRSGKHSQFKAHLKAKLNERLSATVKSRTGPSFEQRMHTAVQGFQKKAYALELEQRKQLQSAVERGRARPTSAPVRPMGESPNQQAMLKERLRKMREHEEAYKQQVAAIKDKMDRREPLFKLSEVQAGFEMLKLQQEEKKRELQREEQERWEHIRAVEEHAFTRPLLLEDANYRPPRESPSAPDPSAAGAGTGSLTRPASAGALGRADNEKDERILNALSQRWFAESDWGKKIKEIKERTDKRPGLHEISYAQKSDGHKFSKTRLMHRLAPSKMMPLHY